MNEDHLAEVRQQREARIAKRKRAARRELTTKIATVTLGVIGLVLLAAGCVLLGAVITKFAWNIGVVNLVSACGGHVDKITLLTALAINFVIGILGRLFHPRTASNA